MTSVANTVLLHTQNNIAANTLRFDMVIPLVDCGGFSIVAADTLVKRDDQLLCCQRMSRRSPRCDAALQRQRTLVTALIQMFGRLARRRVAIISAAVKNDGLGLGEFHTRETILEFGNWYPTRT